MSNDKERGRWHPATKFFLVASLILGIGATIPIIRELDDLRDVRVPAPLAGHALVYGADGFWTNSPVTAAATNASFYINGSLIPGPNMADSPNIIHILTGTNVTSHVAAGAQSTNLVQKYPTALYAHTNLANLGLRTVSVLNFGAVGDTNTENHSAFTNALAFIGPGGGQLLVPRGNYKITGTLTITNNISIVGEGIPSRWVNPTSATILTFYTTNTQAIRIAASTNFNTDSVYISDLLIDGLNSSGTADGINMETPTTIAGVKHVKLENVTVRDFPRHQVRLATNVFDIRFVGCSFVNPNRVTGDDLVRLINPTQVTFDDCWMSQYTPAKWHVFGPAGGMRFFGGTIAPMAAGTTGAHGVYVENGSIHLYGTHIEGPSATATGNIGICYFGRAGGFISPDGISFVGTGVQVGLGGPDPADNLIIGPVIYGNNVRDVWVTAGGSRTNTVIMPIGDPISGASPVIQDDRLAIDGLYEVARLDRAYLAPLTSSGQMSIGRQPHVGLLRLHGGSASSAVDPILDIQNDRMISFRDGAGGKTAGAFIWVRPDNKFSFGAGNSVRMNMAPWGFTGFLVTDPSYPIDSGGSIRIQSGGLKFGGTGTNDHDVAFDYTAGNRIDVVGGDLLVPTEVYDATAWNANMTVPTKDAVRDKIESIVSGSGETNTTLNLGTQSATIQGLAKGKDGVTNLFRSIEAGANITFTSNANTLTITATGSGGAGGGTNSLTGSKAMNIIDLGGGSWQATNGFTFSGISGLGGFSGYIEIGFLITNATDVGTAIWNYGFSVQKDGTYSVTTEGWFPEVNGAFAPAISDEGGAFSGDASNVASAISLSGLDVNGPPLSVMMFYRVHQFGTGTIDGIDYSHGGGGGVSVNSSSVTTPNFRNVASTGTIPSATVSVSGTNVDYIIGQASATEAGVVTTGTQRFRGNKTFDNINLTNALLAQSVTISNLSGSLPVQSDGSDGLISEAINLASSDVTGVLSIGNMGSGYPWANIGTGTNAALVAGNFKNAYSEKSDIETISGATPTVNWQTQPIKWHVVSANITYADSNRPTAAAVGEPITIYMTNSTASAAAISLPSGWRDETGIGFTNLVAGQTATVVAQWMGTEVRYYWRTYEYPYDTVVTGAFTLRTTDHGTLFNNIGASALTTYTLPAASAGLSFEFAVGDTDGIKISAAGDDTIRIGASVTAAAGSITNSVIGGTLKLKAINSTNYYGVWSQGTWLF